VIRYTLDAVRDLVRHQIQLSVVGPASAATFAARVARAEERIEARPRTYRVLKDGETRRYSFTINRTTYLMDYRIEPDEILVLRIWHGRQDRPQ
jgi:plasmid stabilization system protein ParE